MTASSLKAAAIDDGRTIRVIVNGTASDVAARTVAALLDELGYGEARVATAVSGEFVPAAARAATEISDGAVIEIVAPRQGG